MQYTYEAHVLRNKLMPFMYHLDRVTKLSALIPNYHSNIELLYCIEGSGHVVCGAQRYDFCVGDIVVINSNTLHKVESDNQVRYYCLIVDEGFCIENGIDVSKVSFETHISDGDVEKAYNEVCSAYASTGSTKVTSVRYAVLGLLLCLVRNFSSPTNENAYKNDVVTASRIKKVVEYIHSNLNGNICLDDIAEHVGISKYHLSRDFKKFTGNTIFEYVNMARCRMAAALIAGGMNVSAAANESGFENLSYFSRTYKKYLGSLPSHTKV